MGTVLDARILREAMARYLEALTAHREEIDSLNVFPVPDGDTGTNLLLTQRVVDEALRELGDGDDLIRLGEAVSRAALMGARGNSGVILSQILRALFGGLCADGAAGGRALAEALALADEEARKAVAKPVEGTMISVLRDAAAAARQAAWDTDDPSVVAHAAVEAASASLERTTEQLEDLKRAGVVDAGGKGLLLLLDGFASAIRGEPLSVEVGSLGPVRRTAQAAPTSGYGYEVMYLLECSEGDIPSLRGSLSSLGDSVVVVGGGGLYNVHVHTDEPDAAVERGRTLAPPQDVRVTSLDEQVAEACLAGQGREARVGEEQSPTAPLVAVADGPGLEDIFRSLGAIVVGGGPGNNPSVRDLVESIERAPGDTVFILPNHPNIVPASEAAARETPKTVHVIATSSVPEGIGAALAFNPHAEDESNHKDMEKAREDSRSGAIAFAERAADGPSGPIEPGDCLGLSGDEILAVGGDPPSVAVELIRKLGDDAELVTLYVGADASDEEAPRVEEAVRAAFPHLEVEVHRGGQPRYPYLIGLE